MLRNKVQRQFKRGTRASHPAMRTPSELTESTTPFLWNVLTPISERKLVTYFIDTNTVCIDKICHHLSLGDENEIRKICFEH